MDVINILLIAVGLSMDCFAVSIVSGLDVKIVRVAHALRIGIFFGGFQASMPVVGWLLGLTLIEVISSFDHWIAFVLLAVVGGRMIYESLKKEPGTEGEGSLGLKRLIMLSLATSIDALAIGLSFSLLGIFILFPVLVIGVVCFSLSFIGFFASGKLGLIFGDRMKTVGGLILIAIGLRILYEHLMR
jgi:putative Mn2+ efflux pump MntP